MRKLKLLVLMLLVFVGAVGAIETTDRVVLSELTVNPGCGEDAVFTVSIEGSRLYTAYQMSLVLPVGLEVSVTDGYFDVFMSGTSGFYPQRGSAHTLGSQVVDGVLNVVCFSSINAEFADSCGTLFEVHVKASPFLKPGDVEISVQDVMFVTVDEVKYEAVDYVSTTIKVGDVSTYKLKVSAEHQYSTCMLPFDYVLPTDSSLVAYECSEYTSRNLHLDEVDTMLAYTPYIIYSEVGYADTLSGIVDVAKYPVEGYVQKGYLVGVVEQIVIAESNYVMQDKGEGMMFYRVGTTPFVLAAGNCFVSMPEEVKAPSLVIGEDPESSGCMQMKVEDIPVKTYNIYGQCVERMLPGAIYIVDGQKVIVK